MTQYIITRKMHGNIKHYWTGYAWSIVFAEAKKYDMHSVAVIVSDYCHGVVEKI